MRHGRAKAARKTLSFFARTVGIKAPYHVLLDGTFLVALVKYNFPLRERLDKVLQHAAFALYTTKSCMDELEKIKEASSGQKKEKLEQAMNWASAKCSLLEDIPDFHKDTTRMLDNEYPELDQSLSDPGFDILKLALQPSSTKEKVSTKYFVACQDETVLDVLRRAGTVPCLRLARGSVLLLENPSKSGQIQATQEERKKWSASGSVKDEERRLVSVVREEQRKQRKGQQHSVSGYQQRKKRKAKEPNPLSCKKSTSTSEETPSKRRRRKKTSSNHAGG